MEDRESTLVIRRKNFKLDPYWINLIVGGRYVASVWSKRAQLRSSDHGKRWMLCTGTYATDAFIHADKLLLEPGK